MERVNYYLIYGISETKISTQASTPTVNYCLIYGTSEIPHRGERSYERVNYCLVCGTSETMARNGCWQVRGELLFDLWYFRDHSPGMMVPLMGELLLGLRCLRNLMMD